MKNKISYICIAVLILSEAFLLRTLVRQNSEIRLKDSCLSSVSEKEYAMETQYRAQMKNVGRIIDCSCIMTDVDKNDVSLSDIAEEIGGRFIICRYSAQMCQQCIDHTISVIMDNKDSLDMQRILFAAAYNGPRTFKASSLELIQQHLKVFNCPDLGIPAEDAQFPYIMAVDSSLRVLSVYFPTKSTHGTDYDYRHVKYMYDKLVQKE